jgi:hypothetical protein
MKGLGDMFLPYSLFDWTTSAETPIKFSAGGLSNRIAMMLAKSGKQRTIKQIGIKKGNPLGNRQSSGPSLQCISQIFRNAWIASWALKSPPTAKQTLNNSAIHEHQHYSCMPHYSP